MFFFETPPI